MWAYISMEKTIIKNNLNNIFLYLNKEMQLMFSNPLFSFFIITLYPANELSKYIDEG
jgi:hypothetical protein